MQSTTNTPINSYVKMAQPVTNARNLRAYDRLPRAVRDWMKGARLQYSAVSMLTSYRAFRKGGGTIASFLVKAEMKDAENARGGSYDPRFMATAAATVEVRIAQ